MTDPLKSMRRSLIGMVKGIFIGDKTSCRKGRKRKPADPEAGKQCGQCRRLLRTDPVKDCPGCGVVLHSACYDEAVGGYKTPGCRACHHRTH